MRKVLHKVHVAGLLFIVYAFMGLTRTWTWFCTILFNLIDGISIHSSKWGD